MILGILPTIPLSLHGKLYLYLYFYLDLYLYRYLKAQAHADSDCGKYEVSSQITEQCDCNASPHYFTLLAAVLCRCAAVGLTQRQKPNLNGMLIEVGATGPHCSIP